MSGSTCDIYADNNDLAELLKKFDELKLFKYIKMTSELNKENDSFYEASKLLNYKVGDTFIIFDVDTEVICRKINLIDGSGFKNRVDQDFNEDSICLTLGGDIESNTIIASVIDTLGESKRAKEIFKLFKKVVTKNTKSVSRSRVMPNALVCLQSDWRLTQGETYTRDLDLKM
jgi:hypothetical protein